MTDLDEIQLRATVRVSKALTFARDRGNLRILCRWPRTALEPAGKRSDGSSRDGAILAEEDSMGWLFAGFAALVWVSG